MCEDKKVNYKEEPCRCKRFEGNRALVDMSYTNIFGAKIAKMAEVKILEESDSKKFVLVKFIRHKPTDVPIESWISSSKIIELLKP
jgi:hypothetical protein